MGVLHRAKQDRPALRTFVEGLIGVGFLGTVGMISWQAFGASMWDRINDHPHTVTIEGECVGGLCMTASVQENAAR